jgi:hypothetical protein
MLNSKYVYLANNDPLQNIKILEFFFESKTDSMGYYRILDLEQTCGYYKNDEQASTKLVDEPLPRISIIRRLM